MNDNQPQVPVVPLQNKKANKTGRRIFILVVILLAISLGGMYYWQHSKYVDATNTVNDLASKNESLSKENLMLKDENFKNEAIIKAYTSQSVNGGLQVATPTQDDLELNTISAGYVNPDGTVTAGGNWYGVRMTLKNSTSSTISLIVKNIVLKELLNNTYRNVGFSGVSTLPSGWGNETLQDQTIPAGASITGNLVFQMPNKNLSNFTLVNGSRTYPVNASF